MAAPLPLLRACIFDLDGTLLDTEECLDTCIVRAVTSLLGAPPTAAQLNSVRGFPDHGADSWPVRMLAQLGAPASVTPALLFSTADAHFEELIKLTPKMPGAGEVVAALAAAGVPMALCTSSMRHHVALKRLPHEAMFAAVCGGNPGRLQVCVEDVGAEAKPHARPYLAAAALLGLPPAQCVAVEDSVPGITAAVAAGCYVVATPLPHLRERARALGAHVVLDSLLEWQDRVAPLLTPGHAVSPAASAASSGAGAVAAAAAAEK
jgi:beta-phosphoglucomutase-like phosphatase (HAD superfamily)